MPDGVKYPSVLPNKHHLSSLILRHSHHELNHCGLNATLAHARQHFWIFGARQMTRQMIVECITCFRFNCRATKQLMGDLPKERITPSSPFSHVGIDLTGSILFEEQKTQLKCYVILFVCIVTKAIHLDIVRSLSTPDCLQAIRRFISKRGCPKQIYSDNGKYFIGSLNELIKWKKLLREKYADSLPEAVLNIGVNWVTIPARAPSFGGLWESSIKSMKLLMRKTIGKSTCLKMDELYTIICQIEGILNSRPLTSFSDDPKDFMPLTPAMLVNGFNASQLPLVVEPVRYLPNEECPEKRFKYASKLITDFWKQWSKEYLTTPQIRTENKTEHPNLYGDLV